MTFEIQTFGGFSFLQSQNRIFPSLGVTATELLAYLIVNSTKQCYRDSLAEKFWNNTSPEKSRSALNTTLWRLEKRLSQEYLSPYLSIERSTESVHINVKNADSSLDFRALRSAVLDMESEGNSPFLATKPKTSWITAIDRYHGTFLPNINHHWILVERERYRALYFRGCQYLMSLFANLSNYEKALSYGRKILTQDNLRENTHRQVIWLYVMNGQRHKALEQYKSMKKTLRDELGVDPMQETQLLLEHIQNMKLNTQAKSKPSSQNHKIDFTARLKLEQSKKASTFKSLCMAQ